MSRKILRKGMLVTFEGIDGSGKSVQANRAYRYLQKSGRHVIILREPGSTPVAERLRRILLDKRLSIPDLTELLLYEAARSELTARKIVPALERGAIVLADRFFDSTTAYQGYGRGLNIGMVRSLHKVASGGVVPDLTFVFDVDLKTAARRRSNKPDRLEMQSSAFHKRVRRGFLEIACKENRRVKVIDGAMPANAVFEEMLKILSRRLKL